MQGRRAFVLASPRPHRHIPDGSAGSPVPLAVLAEMPGLVDVVVVVITELGVHAIATGTREYFVRLLQSLFFGGASFALLFVLGGFGRTRLFFDRWCFGIVT